MKLEDQTEQSVVTIDVYFFLFGKGGGAVKPFRDIMFYLQVEGYLISAEGILSKPQAVKAGVI